MPIQIRMCYLYRRRRKKFPLTDILMSQLIREPLNLTSTWSVLELKTRNDNAHACASVTWLQSWLFFPKINWQATFSTPQFSQTTRFLFWMTVNDSINITRARELDWETLAHNSDWTLFRCFFSCQHHEAEQVVYVICTLPFCNFSGRTSVRYRFGSPFSSKVVVCGHGLVTLSLTINKNIKMALIAAHLNVGRSGGDSVAIGIYSPSTPTSIPGSPILPVPNKPYGFCGR